MRGLAGKVAIVTGSSLGIGKGIAHRLAEEGMRVVVNGRRAGVLEAAARELAATGAEVLAVAADVSTRAGADELFDRTLARFGQADVLVNNAAWASPISHFLEMTEEHWDGVVQANLKSLYLCCSRMARHLVDRGGGGCIVNLSSFAAARAHRQMAAYDATKGGLEAFTRAIALDLAPWRIRVNAVGPGAIHTEAFEEQGPEAKARRGQTVPLGRVGTPEDVAGAVAFLASDDASYITGQVLYVDGGMLAQLRSPQVDTPLPESLRARLPRA